MLCLAGQFRIQRQVKLLLAFGIVNAIVVTAINPWRVDRLPERFPGIVQDAVIIARTSASSTSTMRAPSVPTY